jgi:hypothetical protein
VSEAITAPAALLIRGFGVRVPDGPPFSTADSNVFGPAGAARPPEVCEWLDLFSARAWRLHERCHVARHELIPACPLKCRAKYGMAELNAARRQRPLG